jgi:hypothetical protein
VRRSALLKYIQYKGAYLLREGRRHSIYQCGAKRTEIPRHKEIVDELARKICKDLALPFMRKP